MNRRQSPLFIILAGWTCVSVVYFSVQAYLVLNSNAKGALLPIILAFGILVKNVGEPIFDQFVSSNILPDVFTKYVHKYPVLKTLGVGHVSSCNLFELLRTITYGCICLASVVDAARTPNQLSAISLAGNLLFRVVLGALLIFKSPFASSLSRLVSCMTKGAAAGLSTPQLLRKAAECLVFLCTNSSSSGSAGTEFTTEDATTEGSVAGAGLSSRAKNSSSAPCGSASLCAVLIAATAEVLAMAAALSTPLLLDLFSAKLTPKSAGLSMYPLLAPARLSAPMFSHTWCALLVAGAVVQCAVLFFAAGYLTYRRAIALELRMHAAVTSSSASTSTSSSSTPSRATTNATPSTSTSTNNNSSSVTAPPALGKFSLGLGRILLSFLDCDVRLSVSLENCRGSGRLSSADAFSAGLQSSASGIISNSSSNNQTLPVPSSNNNNNNNNSSGSVNSNNKNTGGKTRLSVTIPPTNTATASSSNSIHGGGSPRKDHPSSSTAAAATMSSERLQFAPQPHMLLVCVLPVLLVAALQLLQVLLGQVDNRCSWGYAVSGGAALLLVAYLRDAIPRACCSEANTAAHPVPAASIHSLKQ